MRKNALSNGILLSEIMEMTIPELAQYINIKIEAHNEALKERASLDFRFMSAMRSFVWAKYPPNDARKIYPEIFKEKDSFEIWEENKAKMRNFAQAHNKKFKERRSL